MPALKHTHSYIRMNDNKHWKCDDPNCSHFTTAELALGKSTICSLCGSNTFILNKEDMRRRRPRCLNCSDSKKGYSHRRAQEIMKSLIVETPSIPKEEPQDA